VKPIVEAARKAVLAVAPDSEAIACAVAKPKSPSMMWKLVRFAIDGEIIVTIGTFTKHANMFYARGAEIDDGGGVLEGTGKKLRYITLRTPADAKRAAVAKILHAAFAVRARSERRDAFS
jgi:hypothetical protein